MSLKGTLVFSSGRTADFDIWTLELETQTLCQLTHGTDLNQFPRWSPDGSQIAYISTGSDFLRSLYVMDADGKNQRQLTNKMYCQFPSWSPDGKEILFTANAPDPNEIDICRYRFDSNKVEVILKRAGEETAPSYSPDGKRLLFSGVDPESTIPFSNRDTEIWEYDLVERSVTKLFSHPAKDYDPAYSPDGTKIAFVSHRNERSAEETLSKLNEVKAAINVKDRRSVDKHLRSLLSYEQDSDIYVVNRDGTNLQKLTSNQGSDLGVRWSPCGNYLVYSASPENGAGTARLKIIEVQTGKHIPLSYNRSAFMAEIDANPDRMLNDRGFWLLVPDFIERPYRMHFISATFWGQEHHPDWKA